MNEKSDFKQNKNMKHKSLLIIFIFMVTAGLFASLFPYPIFSNYTNITKNEAYQINNHHETELQKQETEHSPQILNLDWQNGICSLLEEDAVYKLIDLKTQTQFYIKILDKQNHADIEPNSIQDFELMKNLSNNAWSWNRRPMLLKYNETTYFPASLSLYPHGHSQARTTGHFCLHFKNSKTNQTNQTDDFHQNTIKIAIKQGKNYIKNLQI